MTLQTTQTTRSSDLPTPSTQSTQRPRGAFGPPASSARFIRIATAANTLVGRLKEILASPPEEQSAKVALWRLGLEQAIATIEQYQGEVREFLT